MTELITLLADIAKTYAEFATQPPEQYIVVAQAGSGHQYTHDGETAGTITYLVDCFSPTYQGVRTMGDSVCDALSGTTTDTGVYFISSRVDNSALTATGMELPKSRRHTITIEKLLAK